ncbi:MAG TPA: hypothetical protein P5080_05885 [Candidatus Paceibacterota bacterium]|nr:hypothetical protein [Candidatus Pacearchaeota archaeon]HRZ51461.1 hypothetical protein [Candidatus Paceibacterota bacterium]HSA37197.1 hypothetical protein [Candidatus Paceibacterota bacterium]
MDANNWSVITTEALKNSWVGMVEFFPKLVIGLLIFVIGWLISSGVGKVVAAALDKIGFDRIFIKGGWKSALEKADIKVHPSEFLGAIVKWILVIVFLLIFVEILGFSQFALFLKEVIAWLPNIVIAAAIFVVSVIIADILEKIINASVREIGVKHAEFIGSMVRWSIYVFAAFAIFIQLGVAPSIINTLIMGIVGMFALAFGLAFGLGGKEAAADLIKSVRNKLSE